MISLELAPPEPREEQRLLHHVLVRLANLPGEARVGDHLRSSACRASLPRLHLAVARTPVEAERRLVGLCDLRVRVRVRVRARVRVRVRV